MRKPVVLITGAGGEIGHGLIERLSTQSRRAIVTLDLARLDHSIASKVDREITGSILDRPLLERVLAEYQVELVFHLAALLSTRSEFTPLSAHQVNVEGTLNLLSNAESRGCHFIFLSTDFIFDGSRGMYREEDAASPVNFYGKTKLEAEEAVREYPHPWAIVRTVHVYGQPRNGALNFLFLLNSKLER